MKLFAPLFLLSLFLIVTACNSTANVTISEGAALPLPDTTRVQPSRDARIARGDSIDVRVLGVEELSGQFDVDQNGLVKIPLIGAVQAADLTAIEFATLLETEFQAAYLQAPDVAVLIETRPTTITIEGAVGSPGRHVIAGTTTLLQAIAIGGGTQEDADTRRVIIFREIGGERLAAGFDLNQIRLGSSEDPKIYGNDVVVVADSATRRTYGSFLDSIPLLGLYLRADAGGR
ncbi:MAG: polysaccharide biosynthesis/export family protein [Pseudomonadota bacterium]